MGVLIGGWDGVGRMCGDDVVNEEMSGGHLQGQGGLEGGGGVSRGMGVRVASLTQHSVFM